MVAVIACFVIGIPFVQIFAGDPIAAGGVQTAVGASISIVRIAIITTFAVAGLYMPIAATGDFALVGAIIGLNLVAIVALIDAILHKTITTGGQRTTAHAGIGVVVVAIVTGFVPLLAHIEVLP